VTVEMVEDLVVVSVAEVVELVVVVGVPAQMYSNEFSGSAPDGSPGPNMRMSA